MNFSFKPLFPSHDLEATRFAGDIATGKWIYAGPAKGIGAAYKGAKKIPKIGPALKGVQRFVEEKFTYLPEAARIAEGMGDSEAGRRVFAGLRAGADSGVATQAEINALGHEVVDILKFARTPEEKQIIARVLDGDLTVPEDSHLYAVKDRMEDISDRLWSLRERSGFNKRMAPNMEGVEGVPKASNYGYPRKITQDRMGPDGKLIDDADEFRTSDRMWWAADPFFY